MEIGDVGVIPETMGENVSSWRLKAMADSQTSFGVMVACQLADAKPDAGIGQRVNDSAVKSGIAAMEGQLHLLTWS